MGDEVRMNKSNMVWDWTGRKKMDVLCSFYELYFFFIPTLIVERAKLQDFVRPPQPVVIS